MLPVLSSVMEGKSPRYSAYSAVNNQTAEYAELAEREWPTDSPSFSEVGTSVLTRSARRFPHGRRRVSDAIRARTVAARRQPDMANTAANWANISAPPLGTDPLIWAASSEPPN